MPEVLGDRDVARTALIQDWKDLEQAIRDARKAAGKSFLGAEKVMRQSPFATPKSAAPSRGSNPRLASVCKFQRLDAIRKLKEFLQAYHSALSDFRRGDREVVFPSGTYKMHVFMGTCCEDPAPT